MAEHSHYANGANTVEERLDDLASMGENWDSYGAGPISPEAIATARKVCIMPTVHGGIEFSWNNEEASVTIGPDGAIHGIYWEKP